MVEKSSEEKSTKEKIMDLLGKGYTRAQLISDLEFAQRTVDSAIKEYRELHGEEPSAKANGHDSSGRSDSALLRRQSEAVLPEWLQPEVAELFDGSEERKKIFLAGIAVPMMGLRLFCEAVTPMVELLATWQKGQTTAALNAQQTGSEIAHAAAEQAAGMVGQQVVHAIRQQAAAQSANPIMDMMVEGIRPQFIQLMGNLIAKIGASPNQPVQGTPLSVKSTQNGSQASAEEIQEVFRNGKW